MRVLQSRTRKGHPMDKNEIYEKYQKYLAPCVSHYYQEPVIFDRGKGKYLYDIDGKEYLDFFGGIVTISVGHCDEEITEKTCEQMRRLQHTSPLYPTLPALSLAEKLAQITPGRLQKSFFTSSGTEAVETAVLIAQLYTKSNEVIALRHCYSGSSLPRPSLRNRFRVWEVSSLRRGNISERSSPS